MGESHADTRSESEPKREEQVDVVDIAGLNDEQVAPIVGPFGAETGEEHAFDNVQVLLDLVFARPMERLRITMKTRVQDLPRSVHPAKQLHTIAAALAARVGQRASPSLLDLATGIDSGGYLFEDALQFDDYCRWCFMSRV